MDIDLRTRSRLRRPSSLRPALRQGGRERVLTTAGMHAEAMRWIRWLTRDGPLGEVSTCPCSREVPHRSTRQRAWAPSRQLAAARERGMPSDDEVAELRGEIVALETALAAAFGEIAALRAAVTGGGAKAAGEAVDAMAADLEGAVLRGVILAETMGQPSAAAGFRAAHGAHRARPAQRDRLPGQVSGDRLASPRVCAGDRSEVMFTRDGSATAVLPPSLQPLVRGRERRDRGLHRGQHPPASGRRSPSCVPTCAMQEQHRHVLPVSTLPISRDCEVRRGSRMPALKR